MTLTFFIFPFFCFLWFLVYSVRVRSFHFSLFSLLTYLYFSSFFSFFFHSLLSEISIDYIKTSLFINPHFLVYPFRGVHEKQNKTKRSFLSHSFLFVTRTVKTLDTHTQTIRIRPDSRQVENKFHSVLFRFVSRQHFVIFISFILVVLIWNVFISKSGISVVFFTLSIATLTLANPRNPYVRPAVI